METLDCIRSRRSVRKYLKRDVPDPLVKKLLDSAVHAPFGGGPEFGQIWEFVVIKDDKIKKAMALGYDDRQYLARSPVLIAVCADLSKDAKYKEQECTISMASQNILLASHDLGLGACYLTTFAHHEGHKEDRERLVKALGLPSHIELIGIITVGYPDPSEKIKPKKLRKIDEILHKDRW